MDFTEPASWAQIRCEAEEFVAEHATRAGIKNELRTGERSDRFAGAARSQRDGDQWIVNGQKIFTTFAHLADYCFLLTRSQPGSAGPRGLTKFLVPPDPPGREHHGGHPRGDAR